MWRHPVAIRSLKDGTERTYERHLLRRSYRDGGKVRKETLANLSHLPPEAIAAVRAVLAGKTLIDADGAVRGRAVAAARARRRRARHGPQARASRPCSARPARTATWPARWCCRWSCARLPGSMARWWEDVTLGPDLGVAGASTDDIYAAMHWLTARQDDIEKQLGGRHLAEGGIAMFDLSSLLGGGHATASWPPAGTPGTASAASRRSSTGCSPTPRAGPVAVRVFTGNTGDPEDLPRGRGRGPRQVRAGADDHGRGPGHDHLARGSRTCANWRAWRGSPACAPPRSRS